MRLFDTERYERIIKNVQTNRYSVSIDGDTDNMLYGLETLASEVKTENQSGNVFLMDTNMKAKIRDNMINHKHPIVFDSMYLGNKINVDPDMIPEKVLFIDPDIVTLSGRVLGIERIGVIDFSDTEQETDE
ncbi:hypothetical protein OSG_eHP22_00155 [environmental Halophage eHP-22]|nr:hypothetical protein OSG_eHP22_00155 [environmental Halophage eHP-22]